MDIQAWLNQLYGGYPPAGGGLPRLLFSGGGGGGDDDDAGDDSNGDDDSDSGTGDDSGGNGSDNGESEVTFDDAQQKKIDAIIGDRLKRAQEQWEKKRKAEDDKTASEREAEELKEQKKFEELAQKRQDQITQLEVEVGEIPVMQERVKKLEEAIQQQLEAMRKELPDHILTLLDSMDVLKQIEYLSEHYEDIAGEPRALIPGTPKPKGRGETTDEERRKKAVKIKSIWS